VHVGDTVLKEEVLDVIIEQTRLPHTRETTAMVVLSLDKTDLSMVNVHWRITVDDIESTPKRVFGGIVVETYPISNDKVVLECEGGERHLKERTMSYGFHNFTVQEMVFYVTRRVPEVQVQEKNIQGLNLNKKLRNFRVILPILNLEIPATMSVMNARFHPNDPSSEDEKTIYSQFSKTTNADSPGEESVWNRSKVRAEVLVEATYFDEAAIEGRRLVTSALDWLLYFLRLSVLGIKNNIRSTVVPWNRVHSHGVISAAEQAYVRDVSEPQVKACLYDFEVSTGEPLVKLSEDELTTYSPVKGLFESTYSRHTDDSRRFWSALHWLRRARESIDDRDKLLDLWIVLEFLVSGETGERVFPPDMSERLAELLRDKAIELGFKDPESAKIRFKDAISQPTLRERFDAFVANASLPLTITSRETEVVWDTLRKARNDLEHGRKDVVIFSEDLDVMDQMLSRIIWVTVNEGVTSNA
jgi:hypothetical protein